MRTCSNELATKLSSPVSLGERISGKLATGERANNKLRGGTSSGGILRSLGYNRHSSHVYFLPLRLALPHNELYHTYHIAEIVCNLGA